MSLDPNLEGFIISEKINQLKHRGARWLKEHMIAAS